MSVLALLLAVAASAFDPGEDAQLYWSDGRMVAVYASRVEFYRYGRLTPGVARPDHAARPLLPGASVRGYPAFLDSRGRAVELNPTVRAFPGGIHPPPERAAASPTISICSTSPEAFCGVLGQDGEEKAFLRGREAEGISRRPVGSNPDGTEALFALTRGGEVVGYRLWRKSKGESPREEELPVDDPQAALMLEAFSASAPSPADDGRYDAQRPARRRRR